MKYLIFTILVCVSCSSPMDKSISEDLTVEEIKEAIDRDSIYRPTLELIQLRKDSLIKTDLDKVKWAEVTYERVFNLVKFALDTVKINQYRENFEADWETKYEPTTKRIDSTISYWRDFIIENSLEQYVKIELVSIDKEYYRYTGGISDVNLGFKLTPLKGKLDQVIFSYELEAKINESEKNPYSLFDLELNRSRCLMSRPFSKPVTKYWEAGYSDREILESRSKESLLRDYNLNLRVDEVRIGGENLDKDSFGVPESIKTYWKYSEYPTLSESYKVDIARELLEVDYISLGKYKSQKIDSLIANQDELVSKFLGR